MQIDSPSYSSSESNTDFLRRHARRMLRDVRSDHPARALPVLRRMQAAGIASEQRLSVLYRSRASLQLKHMLRMLAAELGYPGWADCKQEIDRLPATVLDRFRVDLGAFGDYNQLWFADAAAAQQWQREHGGHLVKYGSQAVVMTA